MIPDALTRFHDHVAAIIRVGKPLRIKHKMRPVDVHPLINGVSYPHRSIPRMDIFYPISGGDDRRGVIYHEAAHIAYADMKWHKVYAEMEAIKIMATIEPELIDIYADRLDIGEECIVRLSDYGRSGASLPPMTRHLSSIVRHLARPKPARLVVCALATLAALAVIAVPLVGNAADYPAPSGDMDHSNGGVMVYEYAGECLRVTPRRTGQGANTISAPSFTALMDVVRTGHPVFAAAPVSCTRYHDMLDKWDESETPWVLIRAGTWSAMGLDGGSVLYPMYHDAASQ